MAEAEQDLTQIIMVTRNLVVLAVAVLEVIVLQMAQEEQVIHLLRLLVRDTAGVRLIQHKVVAVAEQVEQVVAHLLQHQMAAQEQQVPSPE